MFTPTLYRRNNYYDDPFDMFDDMLPAFWDGSNELEKSFSGFSTDISEKDGNYVLEAEMPGFRKEDINIELKNEVLTISAQHTEEDKDDNKDKKFTRKERRTQSYVRSFRVNNITTEDIDASYENGLLTVKFPKRDHLPEQEVKKIEVK